MPFIQLFTTPISLQLDEDQVFASIRRLKLVCFLEGNHIPSRTTPSTTNIILFDMTRILTLIEQTFFYNLQK